MSFKQVVEVVVNTLWVLATLYHANLIWHAVPESMFVYAIPMGLAISFRCGGLSWKDHRVEWKKFPNSLVLLLVILTVAVYSKEFADDFYTQDVNLGMYLYERLGFWALLSMNATDVCQVLLPMFMLVRPLHCIVVMCKGFFWM